MADGASRPLPADVEAHTASASVAVWDLPTRIFHWLLVVLVAAAWLTGGEVARWHEALGYCVAGFLGFRLCWGFIGSEHARFRNFVSSPLKIVRYVSALLRGRAPHHLGHNPAGGAMILALLAVLLTLAITGVMMQSNRFFGVPWVESLHGLAAHGLLVLIPLHIIGVIVSSRLHRENLVKAMVTGRKPGVSVPSAMAVPAFPDASVPRADNARFGREGLGMLATFAVIGLLYGVHSTSRQQAVPAGPEQAVVTASASTAPVELASATLTAVATVSDTVVISPQPEAAATAAALTSVTGIAPPASVPSRAEPEPTVGPDTRAWALASGGRLYDNWLAALNVSAPAGPHPAWTAVGEAPIPPAETWRCVSCHGWDYQGRKGTGPNGRTGAVRGIAGQRGKDPLRIVALLSDATHRYGDDLLPPHAKFRLALFVSEGQHVVARMVAVSGRANGRPMHGRGLYETVCASCHGFDGAAQPIGSGIEAPSAYRAIGVMAAQHAPEFLHKVRSDHPGVVRLSLRSLPLNVVGDLMAYAQTLPRQ